METRKTYPLVVIFLAVCLTILAEHVSHKAPTYVYPSRDYYLEQISSLGYLTTSDMGGTEKEKGVVLHTNESYPGVNIYSSCEGDSVTVMDMDGVLLHSIRIQNISPYIIFKPYNDTAYLLIPYKVLNRTSSGIYGLYGDLYLMDQNSSVVWTSKGNYHHDLSVSKLGEIYSVVMEDHNISFSDHTLMIRDEVIVKLDENGSTKKKISLYSLLHSFIPRKKLERLYNLSSGQEGGTTDKAELKALQDIFHTNNVQIIEKEFLGRRGEFILVCMRSLDLIAMIDFDGEEVLWTWGPGELDGPHSPILLGNKDILVLDNGYHRNFSRLVEVNVSSKRIVWEYKQSPPESFFMQTEGAIQQLPNGNILISESTKGHAFEMTPTAQVVWDFWNPDINETTKKRKRFHRLIRVGDWTISK